MYRQSWHMRFVIVTGSPILFEIRRLANRYNLPYTYGYDVERAGCCRRRIHKLAITKFGISISIRHSILESNCGGCDPSTLEMEVVMQYEAQSQLGKFVKEVFEVLFRYEPKFPKMLETFEVAIL